MSTDTPSVEELEEAAYGCGYDDGKAALAAQVDTLLKALIPRVSPGELRLGDVQELREAVAKLV